jgi:hypothetical protein
LALRKSSSLSSFLPLLFHLSLPTLSSYKTEMPPRLSGRCYPTPLGPPYVFLLLSFLLPFPLLPPPPLSSPHSSISFFPFHPSLPCQRLFPFSLFTKVLPFQETTFEEIKDPEVPRPPPSGTQEEGEEKKPPLEGTDMLERFPEAKPAFEKRVREIFEISPDDTYVDVSFTRMEAEKAVASHLLSKVKEASSYCDMLGAVLEEECMKVEQFNEYYKF